MYTKEFQERTDYIVTQMCMSRFFWISLLQLSDLSLPACDLFLSALGREQNMTQNNVRARAALLHMCKVLGTLAMAMTESI